MRDKVIEDRLTAVLEAFVTRDAMGMASGKFGDQEGNYKEVWRLGDQSY